jgi:tetratricopeptide (TPR) repeat protein
VIRAALLAAAGATLAWGCGSSGGLPVSRGVAGLPPCAQPFERAVDEQALGFALTGARPELPRELDALAALVAEQGGAAAASVELVEGEGAAPDPAAAPAGVGGCPTLTSDRLWVDAPAGRLRALRPGPVVAGKLAAGQAELGAGRFAEARVAFATAAALEPVDVPGAALNIAVSYASEDRWTEAEQSYRRATLAFPYAGEAWLGLGRALQRRGKRLEAVAAWARALALRPDDAVVVEALAGDVFADLRPRLLPPAVRLPGPPEGRARWRLASAGGTAIDPRMLAAEAAAYAGCKEAFLRSPGLRAQVTGQRIEPWRWSPAEEAVCAALWARAYLQQRALAREQDVSLDALVDIARRGFLEERALFDLASRWDARTPLLLDAHRRGRLFQFVERYRAAPRQEAGWLFGI